MRKKAQNLIEVGALLLLVVTLAFGVMISINKLKTNIASLSNITVETAGTMHGTKDSN